MKKITNGFLAAGALCAVGMIGMTTPAAAAPAASVTFSLGNVMFGYSDGYYDQNRRWHRWRNSQERTYYQRQHRASYFNMNRDRDRDHHRRDWRNGKRKDWRR